MGNSGTKEQLLEFVYYYPPGTITINNIDSLGIDGYGMVNMAFNGSIFNPISELFGYTINMTPQAYTGWYNNIPQNDLLNHKNYTLVSNFYNKLNKPYGNFKNLEDQTQNSIEQNNYILMPYATWVISAGQIINQVVLNQFENVHQSNLYALINPHKLITKPLINYGDIFNFIPLWVWAILGISGVLILWSWLSRSGIHMPHVSGAVNVVSDIANRKDIKERERLEKRTAHQNVESTDLIIEKQKLQLEREKRMK